MSRTFLLVIEDVSFQIPYWVFKVGTRKIKHGGHPDSQPNHCHPYLADLSNLKELEMQKHERERERETERDRERQS